MRARAAASCLIFLLASPAGAYPSMSADFTSMMQWLSHEMVQGMAFTAGDSFDPPHEVVDKRLQPDLSLGVGRLPLDKSTFPTPQTPALRDLDPASVFPSSVLFPNLALHLRAGLPWRSDFGLRIADMTMPPNYKLSGHTTGNGQSNSIGFTLRKHVLGGDDPLVTFAATYNHVFGRVDYKTKFFIDNVQGFSADTPINGGIQWNINSIGFNTVVSQAVGRWTPFFGVGYNYASGSVHTTLSAQSQTPLVSPVFGEASDRPEQSSARVIFGAELARPWAHLFFNGEVKAAGINAGRAWIVHSGLSLPFHIGASSAAPYRVAQKKPEKPVPAVETGAARRENPEPELLFLQ